MSGEDDHLRRVRDRLNAHLADLYGREPRWRYFQKAGGPMLFWTVERYDADADTQFAGMYVSGAYQPTGAGSRSGRARTWQLVNDSLGGHELRKDAKARAQRLHRAWCDGNPRPWR